MDDADLVAYVDAAWALNGLVLAPDARERVLQQFQRIIAIGAPVIAEPLSAHDELTPVVPK